MLSSSPDGIKLRRSEGPLAVQATYALMLAAVNSHNVDHIKELVTHRLIYTQGKSTRRETNYKITRRDGQIFREFGRTLPAQRKIIAQGLRSAKLLRHSYAYLIIPKNMMKILCRLMR